MLRFIRGDSNPNTDGLIAGAVAGLSMYQYRSSALALYILIRLTDVRSFLQQLVERCIDANIINGIHVRSDRLRANF